MGSRKTFRVVLIKPSRYDNDGYVVQWFRNFVPSNSLANLYGLTMDCAKRKVLGDDVDIVIDAYDESNSIIPIKQIIRTIKKADGGMVGLVGVQSNQFPRAMEIAKPLRQDGIPIVLGGFHISGCLSMLPDIPGDIQAAMDMGISLFAGEAEGRLEHVLQDVYEGRHKSLYNYLDDLPELAGAVAPFLPKEVVRRTFEGIGSFDSGRGCPFKCSFCCIINVQGNKSRYRTPDDIEALIRVNVEQGITRFFITDDDFVRNQNWEAILDRIIYLRKVEKLPISFVIQVDTMCHRLPNFIEKAAQAGCKRVFIGLESINPESLVGAKKKQNKILEYRKMLQAWKDQGSLTFAGYILGFPTDSPQSIARDIKILQHELPVDLIEFSCLTPIPGSEDHKNLHAKGVWMDPDMNKYTLEQVTTKHPIMTKEEWEGVYRNAWGQYYTLEHVETLMRRGAARKISVGNIMLLVLWTFGVFAVEGIHPLEGGILRRKIRTQRRPGFPRENPIVFYPRRVWEFLVTHARWLNLVWMFSRIRKRVKADPHRKDYTDLALAPVEIEEQEDLELIKVFHPQPTKFRSSEKQITAVN